MGRGKRYLAVICMASLCISSLCSCNLFKKEVDYGLKGKPADANNSVFVLNSGYQKDGYDITSPVFLQKDDTLVIAYSSNEKTILSQYNYIDGTSSEVELEAGIELAKCGTNGNILAYNDLDSMREYYVYNSQLTMIATSKDINDVSENILMSGNGEYLFYANKDGQSINRYKISDKKTDTVYTVDKQKYTEAMAYVSDVFEDASSIAVAVDVMMPENSSHEFICDLNDKSVTELNCDRDDLDVSGNTYVVYQRDENSGDVTNVVKTYDVAGVKAGKSRDVKFEKAGEADSSQINLKDGYALSSCVLKEDSDSTKGIGIKHYDINQGKVVKSIIASADSIFDELSKDDAYSNLNCKDWLNNLDTKVGDIKFNSNKSHIVISFSDDKGTKVLVWRINDQATK